MKGPKAGGGGGRGAVMTGTPVASLPMTAVCAKGGRYYLDDYDAKYIYARLR